MRLRFGRVRSQTPSSGGFTLVELLVVIAIIGILVALLLPAVQSAREAARRAQCQSNLKNIALALLNYESTEKEFPLGMQYAQVSGSVGNVVDYRSTWTIEILPYLENQSLYDSFNFEFSIRDPENRDERGTELPIFLCPSDMNNQVKLQAPVDRRGFGDNWARGNYAGNVGAASTSSIRLGPSVSGTTHVGLQSADSPSWRGTLAALFWPPSTRGIMGPNATVRMSQITDGTTKTMMLAELRAGINEGDPRGVWALGHSGGNLISAHGSGGDANGPNVCNDFSDDVASTGGKLDFGCNRFSDVLRNECMTCNDDSFGFAQAAPRSAHVGGVFIAHVDGSVVFVSDNIETSGIYGACCTPWDYLIMSADGGFVPSVRVRP